MKKAFTLIELISVIVIIGIISALAVPNLRRFRAQVLQNRMKNTLRLVARHEEAFFVSNGYYQPGREGDRYFTYYIYHDGREYPDDVPEMDFSFSQQMQYDYIIYWRNYSFGSINYSYFYCYAIAAKFRNNDIDGDEDYDMWYVSSYNQEPTALRNDL